ncbi:MAG: hypothetical protein KJ064_19000 [Anaerolineae bacterium]|nr:hypothetical protein [Anaerolineae bacterium]
MLLKSLNTLLILMTLGLFIPASAAADQSLPPAAWYAVLWNKQSDTLYWVNADGKQAEIARPKLPNESDSPYFKISPNGRYLVQTALLTNQLYGIGIYDLQTAEWIKTHQAGNGEEPNLGSGLSFNLSSERVAVGFRSGTFDSPAWRVIVFELASGNPISILNSTDTNAPQAQLSTPDIAYFDVDEGLGQEVIHFHLIPYGVGGALEWPSYAWTPSSGTVTESPYNRVDADILPLSGETVLAIYDPNYGQLPPQGPAPSLNAVARGIPQIGVNNYTTIWVDGTSYNFNAQWAKGGEYILYWSSNGVSQWNTLLADAAITDNNRFPFDTAITQVRGTSDGYLFINDQNQVYYTNGFTTHTAPMIFQAPAPVDIAYVTPLGLSFTLASLGDAGGIDDFAGNPCPGAPPISVEVNAQARVSFSNGIPLRVRAAPGGDILTQFPEGTDFIIVGGPQCQGNFNWWQIQRLDPVSNQMINGWVAEGDANGYYIELWEGSGSGVTPVGNLAAPNTETGDGDCSLAPVTQIAVGMNVLTIINNGTLAMRTNLNDEFPSYQIPGGLTASVVAGPQCNKGYRMWKVSLNLNGQNVSGWISEGTTTQYFIQPQ